MPIPRHLVARTVLALLVLSFAVAVAAQSEPGKPARDDLQDRLSAALVAAHEHSNVPAASAAVVRGDRIVWAAAVGVRTRVAAGAAAPDDNDVDAHTRFQAASISKPITALAAMRLCAEEVIELDRPLAELPGAIDVPRVAKLGDEPVTLRRLLSHTAGITVHGFPGYRPADKRPDLAGVLLGTGNTDRIVVDTEPGTLFRYSGGGYCVLQRLLVATREQPFHELMHELVLQPLGMQESTFVQPLPAELWDVAAGVHDRSGAVLELPFHVYPEQAAAGLWTTPSDLVRALLAVDAARRGQEGAFLPQPVAAEMLSVQKPAERFGLGWMVRRRGKSLMFGHSGGNRGFLCDARLVEMEGTTIGYAVMINSEQEDGLQRIIRDLMAVVRPSKR